MEEEDFLGKAANRLVSEEDILNVLSDCWVVGYLPKSLLDVSIQLGRVNLLCP
jgi:hypothetical protein